MPEIFLPFLPCLEFFFLVDAWLLHIMEERDIMGLLCTVTDISRQYTPITATDINRHITEIKATLAAGTNTPVGGIGEEAIIDDENDISTLG